ncbi:TRAFAC clade GTPase domain-containing protein [Bifidobacterium callimiconis]|uniref:Double-GTPase 2 domain-containing protein n=1 Tax=Bifidobacterium callimiconis TaxID=2306973 RepID=A0A430FC06_9BIFI|nr:hypothetical protein [Bifidobacterium callimiconis]MBT1177685.1 hypothetical protein [Bifidobacterium callimiconis]RSX50360.1 hypothetical protein D2E23_1683 [Bifidobacterium callimiconis]
MPGHRITCPYCFKEFDDGDVHFRMETVFKSTDDFGFSNPDTGKQYRSAGDIIQDPDLSEEFREGYIERFKVFSGFLAGDDPKYEEFWSRFGGTSEWWEPTEGETIKPWRRPVHDPHSEPDFFLDGGSTTESGMLYKITDACGRETSRRVCPFCHNPLPDLYGQYPVKFIPVIGASGVGKTVYLSQLMRWATDDFAKCGINAQPASMYTRRYCDINPVEMEKPLPVRTPPDELQQPLFLDLSYEDEPGRAHDLTLVLCDVSGQLCQIGYDTLAVVKQAQKFAPFIGHADGILYLVEPRQFEPPDPVRGPQAVLNVVHDLFDAHANDLNRIPVAVCISKGDTVAQVVFGKSCIPQLEYLKNGGKYRPVFNADSYNKLYEPVYGFVERLSFVLLNTLSVQYPIHDLFMVESIGVPVAGLKNENGEYGAPSASPEPQRLVEPLLWMLNRFGFIGSTGFINEPNDWFCPQCQRRLHITQEFCPDCKCTEDGRWMCPLCGTVNPAGTAQCSHTEKGFLGMTKRCKGTPAWK